MSMDKMAQTTVSWEKLDDEMARASPTWAKARREALLRSVRDIAIRPAIWFDISIAVFFIFSWAFTTLFGAGISWDQLAGLTTTLSAASATFTAIVAAFSAFLYGSAITTIYNARAMAAPALHSIDSIRNNLQLWSSPVRTDAPPDVKEKKRELDQAIEYYRFALMRLKSEFGGEHSLVRPDVLRLFGLKNAISRGGAKWLLKHLQFMETALKTAGRQLSLKDRYDDATLWDRSLRDADSLLEAANVIDRASKRLFVARSFLAFFVGFALTLLVSLFLNIFPQIAHPQAGGINLAAAVALFTLFALTMCHLAVSVATHMSSELAVASAYEAAHREHSKKVDSNFTEQDAQYLMDEAEIMLKAQKQASLDDKVKAVKDSLRNLYQ